MASDDVKRLFVLRDDITGNSEPALRGAAARNADELKAVLKSLRFALEESPDRVYANGRLVKGYAPRYITARGPERGFLDYARKITDALGTWYETASENNAARTA